MRPRIEQELALLRELYRDVEHQETAGDDWFLLPTYPFPPGWQRGTAPVVTSPVAFKVGPGHPSAEPYGFACAADLLFQGAPAANTTSVVAPFPGTWLLFSWTPDGSWRPAGEVRHGSNLLDWARSFSRRLREGR